MRARSKLCTKRRRAKREQLMLRHGRWCWLCNKDILPEQQVTVDHVIPISLGGSHAIDNLRLAHARCNSDRRNGMPPVLHLTPEMVVSRAIDWKARLADSLKPDPRHLERRRAGKRGWVTRKQREAA